MAIKNFTVTAKTIKGKRKGLIDYVQYLHNEKAQSHQNTDILHIYGNGNDFIKKCSEEALELEMKNQQNRKGGRPPEGLAVSFNFVLPHDTIRPTQDEWKKIGKDLALALKDNIDARIQKNHVFMNVHDQSNPHLNMCVSKFMNAERIREVDQKQLLSKLKTQFNQSVLKHCDFDYKDYIPESEKLGKRKQRWQLDKELTEKALEQFKRLVDYINKDNQKRINSTENRLVQTISKISNKDDLIQIIDQTEDPEVLKSIDNIKNKINQKEEMEMPKGNNQDNNQVNNSKNKFKK